MRNAAALVGLCVGMSWAGAARAQGLDQPDAGEETSAELDLFEMETSLRTTAVTATGQQEDVSTTAANVTIVLKEDITAHGWRSLSEVLANVPGLYAVDDLVFTSVGVRGVTGGLRAGSRIVRVMIDGIEVNFRPDLTALLGLEFLPVEAIERVEIAKGPLSALYGANAFLATVNVITRKPVEGPAGEASFTHQRLNAANGWGLPGNGGSTMVSYSTQRGSVLAAISFSQLDRSGLTLTKTFDSQDPSLNLFKPLFEGRSQNDLTSPFSAFLSATARLPASFDVSLRAGLQRLDSIGSFLPTSVFTDGTRRSLAVAWANVRVERPFSDRVKASVSAGITRGAPTQDNATRLTGNRNYSFIENYESTAFEAAASMSAQVLERFTVKAAVDYQADLQRALFFTQEFFVREGSTQPGDKVELIGAENVRNFTLTNFGAFLQGSGAPISSLPRFNVAGTFRVDVPNTFPLQYSWRLGAAYRLTDAVVVKVIGGRAFQMPSGVMLYALTGLGNSINVVGNRTQTSISPIAPQVVHSVEAVLSAQPAKAITFDVAVFYQALDNPIAFQQIANNFIARNRGPQAIAGAEVNLRLTTERVSPYASFSTQLQLPDDDLLNGNSAVTFALPGFPSLVASGGVNVKMPELFLRGNLHVRVVGERGANQSNVLLNNGRSYTLPAYVMVDLTLGSLAFKPLGTAETVLSVTLRNLLDARPSEPYFGGFDLPTTGRSWIFEVRQKF